jgi:hypothetical protein
LEGNPQASSCYERTVCEAFARSSAVFVGRLISGSGTPREYSKNGKTHYADTGDLRFLIEESFKGASSGEITVRYHDYGTAGGLTRGERHLVYAADIGLSVLSTGYCYRTRVVSDAVEDLEVLRRLPQPGGGGNLYGQLMMRTRSGKTAPVPGVTVAVKDETGNRTFLITDQRGRYELRGLTPGKYRAAPVLSQYAIVETVGRDSGERTVPDGGCSEASFQTEVKSRISGKVRDAAGNRAPCSVSLISPTDESRRWTTSVLEGGDGTFNLDEVVPGRYLLYVDVMSARRSGRNEERYYYPGTWERERASLIQVRVGQQVDGVDFRFPPELTVQTITGQILDGDRRPAAGADVIVYTADKTTPRTFRAYDWPSYATADEHGRFVIHAFRGNTYQIWAREDFHEAIRDRRQAFRSKAVLIKVDTDVSNIRLVLSSTRDPDLKEVISTRRHPSAR